MRLLRAHKDAFVTAIKADLPKLGNDAVEKARKLITDYYVAKLPKSVQAIWKNAETRGFLKTDWHCLPGAFRGNVSVPGEGRERLPDDIQEQVDALAEEYAVEKRKREKLISEVRGMIEGCNTLAQAKARIPAELHKYLPTEEAPTAMLPQNHAHIVTSLREMGLKLDPANDAETKEAA